MLQSIKNAAGLMAAGLVAAGLLTAGDAAAARTYYNSQNSYHYDRDDHRWERDSGSYYYDRDDHRWERERDRDYVVRFHDDDRVVVRNYYVSNYKRHCPPGWTKKGRGCKPKYHKVRYTVGKPLPTYVTYHEVPEPLLVQLTPPPRGHRYVMVDNDVLLMSQATHSIVDAITAISLMDNN